MGKIRRKQLEAVYETAIRVLIVIAICWVISMLTSCKSVETVRVPEVHIDTLIQTKWRTDSVVMRDSVVIVDDGERRVERVVQWRDRLRTVTDTTYINRIDSISVPVPYPVEKRLGKWEQAKVDYGGYALVAVIILLTLAIWLARRYCSNR